MTDWAETVVSLLINKWGTVVAQNEDWKARISWFAGYMQLTVWSRDPSIQSWVADDVVFGRYEHRAPESMEAWRAMAEAGMRGVVDGVRGKPYELFLETVEWKSGGPSSLGK